MYKKLNEQFHQPGEAPSSPTAQMTNWQSSSPSPQGGRYASPSSSPKLDLRKSFHLPSNAPLFDTPAGAWAGILPQIITEGDTKKQPPTGRPPSNESSPSSSPKGSRRNLYDGSSMRRESTQSFHNNALLASYLQTNYLNAGVAQQQAAGSNRYMAPQHVKASRLEAASNRGGDSDNESQASSALHTLNMRFKNTTQREASFLFSRQTTSLSVDPTASVAGSVNKPVGLQMTTKAQQDVIAPVNKARVQRGNVNGRVGNAQSKAESQGPKIQRMRKIGVVLPCTNYLDRDEENEIKFGIKSICDAQSPVTMLVSGPSGCGKTSTLASLLNEERHEVFLWYECRAEVIVWMNVLRNSRLFEEETFVDEVVDILEAEFGPVKQRTRVKIKSLLERDLTRRFLFVLDDVYNKRIVDTLLSLGSTIRCILVTRDAKEAGLLGYRSNIRTIPVKELNDRQILHILENPIKEKLGFNKMKPLGPMSLGIPLVASIIRACFVSNEQDDAHKIYGFLIEALSRRIEDGVSLPEPLRTLTKLLIFILGKETNEMRWYFYSFLIFDYNQPIDVGDAAVLWDLKDAEAAAICQLLHSRALLIAVDAVESTTTTHLGYCIHHLVHKAASEAGKIGQFLEQDQTELKARFVNPDVLYRAAQRKRRMIIHRIIHECDGAALEKLCRYKYGTHLQSFMHALLCIRWKEKHYGEEHNVPVEICIKILNKLHRYRIDLAKILAQEDTLGDSALMRLVDNRDDDRSNEYRMLKTMVEGFSQKVICKIAAIRFWTAKLADAHENTPLFMASLRGDYTLVEEIIRQDPGTVSKRNAHGESAIMAAVGTGSLAIVRLLHRVGAANLDEADYNGMNPLLIAAATGRTDILQYLKESGAKMEASSDDGRTALMLASFAGHVECVKFLISAMNQASDINRSDLTGETALMLAALNGHVEVCQMLLQQAADLNMVDKAGCNALQWAAHGGSEDVLQVLLQNGAKLESSDLQGATALMKAAAKGHNDAITLLNSKAARINATDNYGATAMFYAAENRHLKTMQLLHSFGAVVNHAKKSGQTVLQAACQHGVNTAGIQFLLSNGATIDAGDREGVTALMIACRDGKADVADLLIASGASVNVRAKDGTTALYLAAEHGHLEILKLLHVNRAQLNVVREDGQTSLMAACQRGFKEIAEYLVTNGCPINASDKTGQNALMKAAAKGHLDTVTFLLQSGASVNAGDNSGTSALILAASEGHINVVKVLMAKNAKVNGYDKAGRTALHVAIANGHLSIAEILQANGADINQKQKDGTTPMLIAALKGSLDAVQFLHSKRAEVNVSDENGVTPLMEAAIQGHKEVVRFLLRNDANVNALDNEGGTALFGAVEAGHVDIVKMLHDKGALINLRKKNGLTPLMQAAFARNDQIVIFLQQNGAK